jgi:hypothetical protein
MTSTGADIKTAIRELQAAGHPVREIAESLSLHISTIYRWRAGTRRPNGANFTALRELIEARYGQAVHRRSLPVAALHLQAAFEALEDPTERAAFEAEMREKRQVILAHRAAEREAAKPKSVIYQVEDPFAILPSEPEMAF